MTSIKNLVSAKKACGSSHPRITLRFIVMKHNEHQVCRVKPFAKSMGVNAVSFRSAVSRRASIDLERTLSPENLQFQPRGIEKKASPAGRCARGEEFYCHRPYANLTIFSGGEIVACENDYNATVAFGNVNGGSLKKILSSSPAREFFRVFRNNTDRYDFCRSCDLRNCKRDTHNIRTVVLN
jgi:radical SAM protein with 4Fe4S-binding SPASM domain